MGWNEEVDEWDLWQVRLIKTDSVIVRPNFGPIIEEVKIANSISAERVWWVGTRVPYLLPAKPVAAKRTKGGRK